MAGRSSPPIASARRPVIAVAHPMDGAPRPAADRARLDRSAEDLCQAFAIAWTSQASWGAWSQLGDLRPGYPAFVIRQGPEGLGLDTQRWDISGGEACWPTAQILTLSLPWWRRLAERPAQRCLIPMTAACGTLLPPEGAPSRERGGRAAWFTLPDQPLFTVAGLWRDHAGARCFAMLGCPGGDGPWSTLPMIVAPEDRSRWLHGDWDDMIALQAASCSADRVRIGLSEMRAGPYESSDRDGPWHRPRAVAGR